MKHIEAYKPEVCACSGRIFSLPRKRVSLGKGDRASLTLVHQEEQP